MWKCGTLALAALLCAAPLSAQVVRLEITSREPMSTAQPAGAAGPFELIRGRIHGEVDPQDPHNAIIQDLDMAPRNAAGKVEYTRDGVSERLRGAANWVQHVIPVWGVGNRFRRTVLSMRRHNDWSNRYRVTGLVKVLQVEGVVADLIKRVALECRFADLELETPELHRP
jgi:hypothetical protein